MPEGRPAIAASLKRALRFESGDRCAIPTCRGTSALEFAHIEPWASVREHSFENMIVLCAVDHFRYDRGEIERQTMLMYKSNLALLNNRYSDFERRLLQMFADKRTNEVDLPHGHELHLWHLLKDGHIYRRDNGVAGIIMGGVKVAGNENYGLTESGAMLVNRWITASSVDPDSHLG